MKRSRLEALDYLRGVMALFIMVYHTFSWTFGNYDSSTFLGKMGIYGVSFFFVISGAALTHVYLEKLNINNLFSYLAKRGLRIFPLLWICIVLNIFLLNGDYSWNKIILNVTGLFGFVAHDQYISTGSWSIGNELVFYFIFPLIVLLQRKWRYTLVLFFSISLLFVLFFAFYQFKDAVSFSEVWKGYINPLNQLFLFIGGCFIYYKKDDLKISDKTSLIALLVLVLIFMFYPVQGNQLNIVKGFNRTVFIALCLGIVALVIKTNTHLPRLLHRVFRTLGDISYSLYLLHPIVFWYLANFIDRIQNPFYMLLLTMLISFVLSFVSYYYFEIKIKELGTRLLNKTGNKRIS